MFVTFDNSLHLQLTFGNCLSISILHVNFSEMKIVVAKPQSEFRQEDIQLLNEMGAIFYGEPETKFADMQELFGGDEVILVAKPGGIDGVWESLSEARVEQIKNLKAVCLSTTGTGWAPVSYLQKKGVIVTYTPGKSTDAVAEYGVMMSIGLLRGLPLYIKNNWSGEGLDVRGRTLVGLPVGVVGLGNIGGRFAELASKLGAEVSYWNRSPKQSEFPKVELAELFAKNELILISVADNAQTKGMISRELIDNLSSTACVVAIVDGICDHEYLLQKVADSEIGGYAFEGDQDPKEFSGNVFSLPEIAYYTKQTLENESRLITESVQAIVENREVPHQWKE